MNISPSARSPIFVSSLCPAHECYWKYICIYIEAIFILRLYEDIFAYNLEVTLGNIEKIILCILHISNTIIYATTGIYLV